MRQQVTVQAYQAKCSFCGQKFIEFKPHLAEAQCHNHMLNDCCVLRYLAIAKDMPYPIKEEATQ